MKMSVEFIDEKLIQNMLMTYSGNIVDCVEKYRNNVGILAVVNAANPTLMGSSHRGVDASIHEAIDSILEAKNDETERTFRDKIRKELDSETDLPIKKIRCKRGEAVITRGYEFCDYVIHVVGKENDYPGKKVACTSKCTSILEACYRNIVKSVCDNQKIETLIIPIIGSGNYNIPFKLAASIAVATIGNELLHEKKKDIEYFNYMALKRVIFCILDEDENRSNLMIFNNILKQYKKYFERNHRVVYQNSVEAQIRYIRNIKKYDESRGYFLVAKYFRLLIAWLRMVFIPILFIKDLLGGVDWQKRRGAVESITVIKLVVPFILAGLIHVWKYTNYKVCGSISLYLIFDTITYLLCLIFLSDIQRPSANVIRSMILLFINYLEVSVDISLLYYIDNHGMLPFRNAIKYGLIGNVTDLESLGRWSAYIYYMNVSIKFFFKTLAFGYFIKHLKERKFRS